jgi:regulation of enolase protein 1 (concanavalin A-like superfamily)
VDLTVAGLTFSDPSDAWSVEGESTLSGWAGRRTDLFVDPSNGRTETNAPRLVTPVPRGDFQLSARVGVEFGSTYDAGVLLVWAGEATWAKLCFELSPQGQPMIVSVVTRGRSDDADGLTVDGSAAHLRISRLRGAYAFHASTDGEWWHLIRHFALDTAAHGGPELGFEVQSPLGEGCRATYQDVSYRPVTLNDLRDGR